MSLDPFAYSPVPPRHIRVLQISASPHPSGTISCKSISISLSDRSEPYIAISYTWGSPEKRHYLLINDHLLPITQTVHEIFQSKIIAVPGSRLWIDACLLYTSDAADDLLCVDL